MIQMPPMRRNGHGKTSQAPFPFSVPPPCHVTSGAGGSSLRGFAGGILRPERFLDLPAEAASGGFLRLESLSYIQ